MQKPLLFPSLLAADFSKLGQQIQTLQDAGVEGLHWDVMDGHFVPNLTLGPVVMHSLRAQTSLIFDCHLMVNHPENWIRPFAKVGAEWISVHVESTPHLNRVLMQIKEEGCRAGVALNPATPLGFLDHILDDVDFVLLMTVNPGFGGQLWIDSMQKKIQDLVALRQNRSFLIQVDGAVSSKNVAKLRAWGVDVFVVGSALFQQPNLQHAVNEIRLACN